MKADKIEIRDFAFFILCHGRPKFCMTHTWHALDIVNSKARRIILCSDDDNTIPEYQEMFGKENVYVFNKEKVEKELNLDVGDCFDGQQYMRKGAVWVRNAQFGIARELGIRYFCVIDDDTHYFCIRERDTTPGSTVLTQDLSLLRNNDNSFDTICELYFRMLDSAPFVNSVAFGQGGDYIGGVKSILWKRGIRFKTMNSWFCDAEKEFRYYGRMNDDANGYIVNSRRGKIFFTISGMMLNQPPTQKIKGGMTDIYKKYGTWLKSMYSVMMTPSAVMINAMGNTKETRRIHHMVDWIAAAPKILSGRFARTVPLDYNTEVCQDIMHEGKIPPKTEEFMSAYSDFKSDIDSVHCSIDGSFFDETDQS